MLMTDATPDEIINDRNLSLRAFQKYIETLDAEKQACYDRIQEIDQKMTAMLSILEKASNKTYIFQVNKGDPNILPLQELEGVTEVQTKEESTEEKKLEMQTIISLENNQTENNNYEWLTQTATEENTLFSSVQPDSNYQEIGGLPSVMIEQELDELKEGLTEIKSSSKSF